MRLAYLSADRIELQFANKELARSMTEPTTTDVENTQEMHSSTMHPRASKDRMIVPKQITCHIDSNFAGCLQSKKSTSSCNIFDGKHLRRLSAFSSAEAEFYEAIKATASGIGCVSMMRDLGVTLQQQGVEVKARWSGDGIDSPSLEIKAGCNGKPSHCNATRCLTYQTYRNTNAMVATSRDQWRHQDGTSWWK